MFVKNAESHIESCSIKGERKPERINVEIAHDCYLKRNAGIEFKPNRSLNNSYWYGIFAEIGF